MASTGVPSDGSAGATVSTTAAPWSHKRLAVMNRLSGILLDLIPLENQIRDLRKHHPDVQLPPTANPIQPYEPDFVDAATVIAKEATLTLRHFTADDYRNALAATFRARASGSAPEVLDDANELQAQKREALLSYLDELLKLPPPPVPIPSFDKQAIILALVRDPEVNVLHVLLSLCVVVSVGLKL
jgi:hypothetical protein